MYTFLVLEKLRVTPRCGRGVGGGEHARYRRDEIRAGIQQRLRIVGGYAADRHQRLAETPGGGEQSGRSAPRQWFRRRSKESTERQIIRAGKYRLARALEGVVARNAD